MTAAEQQVMGDSPSRYVEFDEFIEYQVKKARSGIHQTDLLAAGLVLALFTVSYLLAFVVLDQWFIPGGFGYRSRVVMLTLVLSGALGWTTWRIVLPYFRRINALYAAREIEAAYPDLQSTLLTWVDLKAAGRAVPPVILQAIEKRAALEMAHKDIDHAIDRRFLMRSAYALLAVLAVFCLYTIFSPKKISASIWRALLPTADVAVATTTSIVDVQPGDSEVLARSQVEVMAELAGVIPEEVTLLYSTADRRFVNEPVLMHRIDESLPRFQATLTGENGRGLLQDVRYRIEAGDARSREFQLRVNLPPSATVTEVAYDYPEYMGLDDQTQPGGNIDAWEGTRVTVRALANMPVKSATILFSDTEDTSVPAEEVPLEVTDGVHLKASWPLAFRSDGTYPHFYRIQVKNERGENDPQPSLKSVKIRPDLPPEIRLLHPTGDSEAPANGIIPIAYEALDPDFLLRRVVMKFEKQGEELPASPTLYEGPPFVAAVKSTYRLELERLNLKTGDKLAFYLRAEDNMEPFGDRIGNVRQTPKLNITIVDPVAPEKVQEQLKAQEKQIEQLRQADQQQNSEDQMPQEQPGGEQGEHRIDDANPDDGAAKPVQDDAQPQDGSQKDPRQPMTGDSSSEPTPEGDPKDGGSTSNGSKEQPGANPGKSGGEGGPQAGRPGQEGNQHQAGNEQAPHSQTQRGSGDARETGQEQADRQQNGTRPSSVPQGHAQNAPQESAGQSGDASNRRDKAAEDEALRELLKWSKEHQQENPSADEPKGPGKEGDEKQSEQGKQGEQPQEDGRSASEPKNGEPNAIAKNPSGKETGEKGGTEKEPSENAHAGDEKNSPPTTPPGTDNRGQNPNGTGTAQPPTNGNDPSSPMPQGDDPSRRNQEGQNPNGTGAPQPQGADQPNAADPATNPGGSKGNGPPMPGAGNPNEGENPAAVPSADSGKGNDSGKPSLTPGTEGPSEKNGAKPGAAPAAGDQPKTGAEKNGSANDTPPKPGDTGGKPGETVQKPDGKKPGGDRAVEKVPGPDGEHKAVREGEKPPQEGDSGSKPADGSKPTGPSGTDQKPGQPHPNAQPDNQAGEPGKGADQQPSGQGAEPNGAAGSPPQSPNTGAQKSPSSADPKLGAPQQGADPSAPMQPGEPGQGQGKEAMNRQDPQAGPSPSGTGTQGQNGKPAEGPGGGESKPSAPDGRKSSPGEKGGSDQGTSQKGQQPMPGEGDGQQKGGGQDAPGGQGKNSPSDQNAAGNKSGDGRQSQEGNGKTGDGKSGAGQQRGGKSGEGAAGDGQSGQPGQGQQGGANPSKGQGQGPAGAPVGGGTGSPNAGASDAGSGGAGGEGAGAAPEPADLANRKKAANLALQQLRDELQRGEPPQQLLDRLGYTEQELQGFMRRLEERLADPGLDSSPEAEAARRQFESLLRGAEYKSTGGVREGGSGPRQAAGGFGAGNRPVPPEYRAAEQAYKKKLSGAER